MFSRISVVYPYDEEAGRNPTARPSRCWRPARNYGSAEDDAKLAPGPEANLLFRHSRGGLAADERALIIYRAEVIVVSVHSQRGARYGPWMPLHYVDPNKERGLVYRAYNRVSRTRPMQYYGLHVAPRIDPWLYRATGGRYPRILGSIVSAPLMTTGAKSGQPREVQVTYFHDGPDAVLTASYGGGPKNPQWYYNLKAHPECQLGDERFLATEVTDPDEYARLYALGEKVYAGYADYRVKTAAFGRHIPVFRLTRR